MNMSRASILQEIRDLLRGPALVDRKVRAMMYLMSKDPKRYTIHKLVCWGRAVYGLLDGTKVIDIIIPVDQKPLFPSLEIHVHEAPQKQ